MINWNSILSSFDNKPTLLQWLKKVEKALKEGSLKNVSIEAISETQIKFKFTFADNTFIESGVLEIPNSGKIDAFDLLALIKPSEGIIADISEDNTQVELHLDQTFINSLATKEDLKAKQDKLSQVDLDNIAMINQYGQDIKSLKEKTNVIDNTSEVITLVFSQEEIKNKFVNTSIQLTNLPNLIKSSTKDTRILQKVKFTYNDIVIEETILLDNFYQATANNIKGFYFSLLSSKLDKKVLISGKVYTSDLLTNSVNVVLTLDNLEASGGGGFSIVDKSINAFLSPEEKYSIIGQATREEFNKAIGAIIKVEIYPAVNQTFNILFNKNSFEFNKKFYYVFGGTFMDKKDNNIIFYKIKLVLNNEKNYNDINIINQSTQIAINEATETGVNVSISEFKLIYG